MSYSAVSDHRTMVFDTIRNSAYGRALRRKVGPDTVVLDIGAGLGVLGLLAAAAGARRVYLVEPEPVVQLAHELAAANGLADRIVVLQGRIEDIVLPEQVDLIVSVFTGNLLYSEDLLPSLFLARDRWLRPGGCLLPDRAELLLAPWSAPALHDEHIGRWALPCSGFDFGAARRFAANEVLWLPRKDVTGAALGPGAVLAAPDLMTATQADCKGSVSTRIDAGGLCHGLLGWIRLRLGDEWLSTAPDCPELHWLNAFLPLDPPLLLEAGGSIDIGLQRPAGGDWSWSLVAGADSRRHSTFLSRLDGPARLRKLAPGARPQLQRRGSAALAVLAGLQAQRSNEELAQQLARDFADLFGDEMAALRFVRSLVVSFATAAAP